MQIPIKIGSTEEEMSVDTNRSTENRSNILAFSVAIRIFSYINNRIFYTECVSIEILFAQSWLSPADYSEKI